MEPIGPDLNQWKELSGEAGVAASGKGVIFMKMTSSAIGILAVLAAGQASAQSVNLTGPYRCIEACRAGPPGAPAFITQNGADLNLLNEAGESVRAWPD
jgi:hypothetical protein